MMTNTGMTETNPLATVGHVGGIARYNSRAMARDFSDNQHAPAPFYSKNAMPTIMATPTIMAPISRTDCASEQSCSRSGSTVVQAM